MQHVPHRSHCEVDTTSSRTHTCSAPPLPQRVPSTAGASAGERSPCDLLAWGAAQRAPVAASVRSSTGAQEDCWQHRSAPGLAPGGTFLDASMAAVGRKHAAVVTATGALYTWGEGRAGKLGLGHDQVGRGGEGSPTVVLGGC